jgi:hypothetical protein
MMVTINAFGVGNFHGKLLHAFSTVSYPTSVFLVFPEAGNTVCTSYIGEYHDQRIYAGSDYLYIPRCCPPPF